MPNRIRRLTEKEEELYKYDVCNRLVEKQTRKLGAGVEAGTGKKPESSLNPGNAGTTAQQRTKEMEASTPTAIRKPDNILPFRTSTFQYDSQGNLLREERKTEGNRQESIYSYDGFNRQKKIVNFESKVQVNHYDGEGLRHEMEENGKLVKFLYNDREAVAEEKEDGNTIRYIRGYDLVASDSESARTYYHYASDEQGSITHVLGEDGNGSYGLRNYYEYGAFGDFREKEEETENRFGYNGEIFDPIGGQYYLRARYYNPVIGRFTQEDTYYGDGLNLYAYCANLPIGYVDPSGHYPCQEKQDLYKKYREQGMTAQEANRQANYDLIKKNQGVDAAEKYLQNEKIKNGSPKKTPLNTQQQKAYDAARAKGLTAAEAYYIATGKNPLNQAGSDYMALREQQKIMNRYQQSANQSYNARKGTGNARQVGTWTHDDVKSDMRNYWNNNSADYPYIRSVSIENTYLNGGSAPYNTRGSSRIDIVITNKSNNNVHIADLKTGSAKNTYGTKQKGKNERNYGGRNNPNGYTYTHQEVRPK